MTSERDKSDDRLAIESAAVLFIDHQSGLFTLVRDQKPEEFRNNVLALADTAKLLKLPVVLTTSNEKGPNGPLMPELRERFPKAAHVAREGEINAWDSPEFVKAVKATKRKQLIIAGITTDVCVAFVAMSAVKAGYKVYVVADASGSLGFLSAHTAYMRMGLSGVQLMSWFAVVSELIRDWRKDEKGLLELFREHLAPYKTLIDLHGGSEP